MTRPGLIPVERIESSIYLIRGEKVMLDRDLAALYGVGTHLQARFAGYSPRCLLDFRAPHAHDN